MVGQKQISYLEPFRSWLTFAAILTVLVVASFSSEVADPLASQMARVGLTRVFEGNFNLGPDHFNGFLKIALVLIIQPIAILGILFFIERLAGPRVRMRKNYRLTLTVQVYFVTFGIFAGYAVVKWGPLPASPFFQIRNPEGLVASTFVTFVTGLLYVFVADFFRYWFHRAQHHFAPLWRFHAVHHSARDLDVLHAFNHPLEQVGNAMFITMPTLCLMGLDVGQLQVVSILFAAQTYIVHMNIPVHYGILGRLIVDNRYHFLHHSSRIEDFDKNFAAIFPVFDLLFGTYRAPGAGPLPPTGISSGYPKTFQDYLLGRLSAEDGCSQEHTSEVRPVRNKSARVSAMSATSSILSANASMSQDLMPSGPTRQSEQFPPTSGASGAVSK